MKNRDKKGDAEVEISESNNFFKSIAYRYIPYWPVFLFTFILSLVAGWVYFHYQSPLYQASATILLKDDKSNDQSNGILESLNITSTKKNVENELGVLKSNTLMRQVVTKMGLYAQIYHKGSVRDVLAYPSSPVTFTALFPEKIKTALQPIKFSYLPKENVVVMDGEKYPLNTMVNTPYGIFRITPTGSLDSAGFADSKHPLTLHIRSVTSIAKSLSNSFSVSANSKQSSIIGLKFIDENPQRAEAILDSLISIYSKNGVDDKNTIAARTLAFLEDRLKIVNGELAKVEGDIQDYKSKENIVDVSEEGKMFLSQVQESDVKINEINVQLSVLDEVEKYILRKADVPGVVPGTAVIADPLLSQLLYKLYEDDLELDRLRKISGENSPAIIDIKTQIAQLKPSLLENVRTIRQNLKAALQTVQAENNRITSSMKQVPQKERVLLEISRDQFIKSGIYSFLLQKREETQLSLASTVSDDRIIDPAEANPIPISPVAVNIYLIAIIIGIIVAVCFVLIREVYNRLVLFRTEIDHGTTTPVIAEILYEPGDAPIVVKDGTKTIIGEQFRALRTSLGYYTNQSDKKVILMTSSISGEGKSFTAINLAISFTLTNKKVALLELDMRKPKFSRMLNIPRENGLSEYLSGLVTSDSIRKEIKGVPNLTVFTSGSIARNPTELILTEQLDKLIAQLREEFDYVILDSPPVSLISDAKLLNKYADISLYIIRHNYTPKLYLRMIDEIYQNEEFNNMNIIFNGIKPRGILRQGFGQGFGQSYGYGYGYDYDYTEDARKPKSFIKRLFKK